MTQELTFPRTDSNRTPRPGHEEGWLIRLCEDGWIPDALLRPTVRLLCRLRLADERRGSRAQREARLRDRLTSWRAGPVALAADEANEQHYEVPPEFFARVLGRHLKYSCALWPEGVHDLDAAEATMLRLTCERAGLADGMSILELGCGWGSLTLWMAAHYPASRITAVSNSASQRGWIEARARSRGLCNIKVLTADINAFTTVSTFDRVVSVEMFEHMRNHAELLRRIRSWLADDGRLFVHHFCHRSLTYPFELEGRADWMARHFFSGGMMPSYDLLGQFDDQMNVAQRWWHPGTEYAKTSEAWLARLDADRDQVLALFARDHDDAEARRMVQRWRMFFLAVAEFFALDDGTQWGVGHYVLKPAT